MPHFSQSSKDKLATCDPILQELFNFIIQYYDCKITSGHRGEAEQNEAYDTGHSQLRWPQSKHNKVPARAVDVVPYPVIWSDIDRFKQFGQLVKVIAWGLSIDNLEWGGDWSRFKDYPHYQLNIMED